MMLSRIRIVLMQTSHPGNIGAAARAMKTMGHASLYLVQPADFPGATASARAAGAGDVLANAVVCDSLEAALQGCQQVYATSARTRRLPWPEYTPTAAADRAYHCLQAGGTIAVVFGRESSGLSNAELARCQALIRIPTAADFQSLNLAAAVQLICYEFYRCVRTHLEQHPTALTAPTASTAPPPPVPWPDATELEQFYERLENWAIRIGFFDPQRPRRMRQRIRLLCNRACPDRDELQLLHGLLTAATATLQTARNGAAQRPAPPGVACTAATNYHAPVDKQTSPYKAAGVDIAAGQQLVERIRKLTETTRIPGVMDGIGSFAAAFDLAAQPGTDPILVAATDGVGTKLRLLAAAGQHHTAGIDLVAMCVNDVLCRGARPLFFLDYMAFGRLELPTAEAVVAGIADGCRQAQMALIGGETAEMPGFYQENEYDLAGFCVGMTERELLLSPAAITAGDVLIGIASSGAHANGYTLIRQLLQDAEAAGNTPEPWLMQALLAPTRIYAAALTALRQACTVHGIAHITGGGLPENVARILPAGCSAVIHLDRHEQPRLFNWLQRTGGLSAQQMYSTFNCGIGLVICVPPDQLHTALHSLQATGEAAWELGHIAERTNSAAAVQIADVWRHTGDLGLE